MDGLADREEIMPSTPFGEPSDKIIVGTLHGIRLAFLPRHGVTHRLSPSEVPFRANIFALKSIGVHSLISVSAVGSLHENIRPLDMVMPDQVIDRTKGRPSTFFKDGIVAHVGFAEPFCPDLGRILHEEASAIGVRSHLGGTYVAMEGPQFSTRAESELYRSWGGSVIGMTALPEAKLAREAEICYATLACSTDYDCWHPDHDDVTVDLILKNLNQNVSRAKEIIRRTAARLGDHPSCQFNDALRDAIVTPPELIPEKLRRELAPLISKYAGVS